MFFLKKLILAILLSVSAKSASQNIAEVMFFADKLVENQNYPAAINEYRRAYFFACDEEKYFLANKIADCYIADRKIDLAKIFCDSAYFYSLTDSARAESYLKKITCVILENSFGDALVSLKTIDLSFNPQLETKKQILAGIASMGLNDFEGANIFFTNAIGNNDSITAEKLRQLFGHQKKLQRPYPMLAGGMSVLVPGSGQIYAGKIADGLSSLALLAGITYMGYAVPTLRFLFSSMLIRYYMGGFTRAHLYADQKRQLQRLEFSNEILSLFSGYDVFIKETAQANEFKEFRKLAFNSDGEIPILISTAFLFYKKVLSAQDVDACVFTPTCSVYMMETIRKNGIVQGLLDGTDRLMRCHGFADHNHYHTCKTTGKLYDAP